VVAGVLLFWAGTLVAGSVAANYSLRADYVSSLAGRGSSVGALGVAALLALALAHLVAAAAVRGRVGASLALAGIAGLAVAAFRTGCPLGAAGCGWPPNDAPTDLADSVHGYGVVAYEAAFVVAMVLVAAGAGRWTTSFRVLTAVAAVASIVLVLQTGGDAAGAWQRAWLAVNTAWLVTVALRAR
jgi:hypothetical protein